MKKFAVTAGNLVVHGLPAFEDNILYVVEDPRGGGCTAVDPGDASVILSFLSELNLQLDWILITHHHSDHVGGVLELAELTGARIIAPNYDRDRLPFRHGRWVTEGDLVNLGHWNVEVRHCPGHTKGHVIYSSPAEPVVFVGDVLFVGGCGRIFEGSFEEMRLSLRLLLELSPNTLFFCAHDYGPTNLRFLETFLAENQEIRVLRDRVHQARSEDRATMPFTIDEEKRHNPFLGQMNDELRTALKMPKASDAELFRRLREMRNHFS